MKWQAIASVTHQVNEEAKGYYLRKLEKDASVQIPHLWSDFISDTAKHLHESQGNIEIANDERTGSLTALTQFDELHPDFLDNRKPFIGYFLGKYDERAAGYLANAKNPFTRKFLQNKIGEHRIALTDRISHTEAKLIDDKRKFLAIEAVEKLKNATYDSPDTYTNHLQDSTVAITSLSLLPQERESMLRSAKEELAYSAALGTMRHSPGSILNLNVSLPWREDLSFEQRLKIEQQASRLLHHQQIMQQHQVASLSKAHFASILKNRTRY